MVTIECSGILPCSTAAETVVHIKKTWDRGQVKPLSMSVFGACVVFSTFMLSFVTCKPWPNIGPAGNGAGGIGGRTR